MSLPFTCLPDFLLCLQDHRWNEYQHSGLSLQSFSAVVEAEGEYSLAFSARPPRNLSFQLSGFCGDAEVQTFTKFMGEAIINLPSIQNFAYKKQKGGKLIFDDYACQSGLLSNLKLQS